MGIVLLCLGYLGVRQWNLNNQLDGHSSDYRVNRYSAASTLIGVYSASIEPPTDKFLHRLSQIKLGCASPDFLVVGTQKGGTSSFHAWIKLGLHPDLHVPKEGKELNLLNEKLSIFEESFDANMFERYIHYNANAMA